MTRLIPSTMTLAVILTVLTAPTSASAKGPQCELEVHRADFTRPIYEAGHWVSARLDVSMTDLDGEPLVPGTESWGWCARAWSWYVSGRTPMQAQQDDPARREAGTQQTIGMWLDEDGDDLIVSGWIDPLQAGGAYVLDWLPGEAIRFEVAPNPDADAHHPEPVGISISYVVENQRWAGIYIDVVDASSAMPDPTLVGPPPYDGYRWVEASMSLRSLSGEPNLETALGCTEVGVCRVWTPNGTIGRYVIEHLWLEDRFGNRGDVADHPLFDDIVIDLTVHVDDLNRGTLAPEMPEIDDDPAPDDVGDDEGARAPQSDGPPTPVDDETRRPPDPIDPIEEPAPTAARRAADGCSATPDGGPSGGGLMVLALLAGWRRRAMR